VTPPIDTSRDQRIIAKLRTAMRVYLEACSIAYALHAPEAAIATALRRLESDGQVVSRTVRRHLASTPVTEWGVRS
jgi:hypothetical protein